MTITPYAAGRMIGAAVWRVSWQTEDNDIVYATAYNHNHERYFHCLLAKPATGIPLDRKPRENRVGGVAVRCRCCIYHSNQSNSFTPPCIRQC